MTKPFEIVAHRGIATDAPENTILAFQRAVDLGADAFECDVRLTADRVPIVHHYFYLHQSTSTIGTVFDYTLEQLRDVDVYCTGNPAALPGRISTLQEILDLFGGRIGLEIEIKGPEPEAPRIVGDILKQHRSLWDTIEVTSYEPALLLAIQRKCRGLPTDLLYPRTESWMKEDVMLYQALHRSRLAHARAVHLNPTQLSETVVSTLRRNGIEVHAWDVNDQRSLEIVTALGIPRVCTDRFAEALAYRQDLQKNTPA